jgi:hypothetical protein
MASTRFRKIFLCSAHDLIAKPLTLWRIMRLAGAAFGQPIRDRRWQAFCLAKQASIRYTA